MTTTVWVEDHFIAGDLALDFANTVYRRWPVLGADLFTDTEALRTWLTRTHLVPDDGGPDGTVTGAALADARALRALCWTVFDAQRAEHTIPMPAVTRLLETARDNVASVTLRADGTLTPADAHGALAVLALRAVTLVLNPPPRGVRACDRCGWFFIDSSRGRRRRWCSMKTCGNQAKAARFRATSATAATR